ncbi:MAG: hypothetical protein H7645_05635 [Candidatus Heimdallarchaeota archaeon]|nr:hypothetical protein [Candidatus Heimdallarchaeota archaeon]MCK4769805.1 hypothetical protein [Candidatus Heimdallarchaeota archaeon]
MLAVENVAKAVRFLIDQEHTSNIDHILLMHELFALQKPETVFVKVISRLLLNRR